MPAHPLVWYNVARKWFTVVSFIVSPLLVVIDAPFGRFTLASDSIFKVDGINSWMLMETVSPVAFLYALWWAPLSGPGAPPLGRAPALLAGLYLIHYLNRAILSPLRTPSRSKSHIIIPVAATVFNLINGTLMGAYLASPTARAYVSFRSPLFYVGVALWAAGFAGNIIHDEMLLDIRRKAKAKGKGRAGQPAAEHYAIPHGLLYAYISYPNYLCEWAEWLGFALAAAPPPLALLSGAGLAALLQPAARFAPALHPPYIFFLSEVLLMLPRAWKGHQWYRAKFPEYPAERRAVIPFVL